MSPESQQAYCDACEAAFRNDGIMSKTRERIVRTLAEATRPMTRIEIARAISDDESQVPTQKVNLSRNLPPLLKARLIVDVDGGYLPNPYPNEPVQVIRYEDGRAHVAQLARSVYHAIVRGQGQVREVHLILDVARPESNGEENA